MYKKLLIIAIILYIILFTWICFWKYFNFGYNGLDLAIYNQVFFNSAHGNFFQSTIHPHSYLGDHFELFIIFLLPFYYLYQNPLTLLFLQTVFLALVAWPLFLIAKKLINERVALFLALLWLLNPFVQNVNLFEFHLLPFALIFLFFAFYYYQEKKIIPFIIFLLLALLVREDVAFLTLMFGILALIEKRSLKWILWPIIISAIWFIIALKIITSLAPNSQFKFLYYYSWLGNNFSEIIKNALLHPWLIIRHLITWQTMTFFLIIFMPFGYLNIFQKKYLLLGFLVLLQLLMAGADQATLIPKIHYVSLLLIPLFLALTFEIRKILNKQKLNKLEILLSKEKIALFITLSLVTLYSTLVFGPFIGISKNNFKKEEVNNKKEFLKEISRNDSLLTSFDYLTLLSSRSQLYSLYYSYIGKLEFSNIDYKIPDNIDKLLIDTNDFLFFDLTFPEMKIWQDYYPEAAGNFREFLQKNNYQVAKVTDSIILWQKLVPSKVEGNTTSPLMLYELNPNTEPIMYKKIIHFGNGLLKLYGWDKTLEKNNYLHLSLYFQALNKIKENFNLRLIIIDENNKKIYQKDYPVTYGLYPPRDWKINEIIKINYHFILPENLNFQNKKITFQLINQKGNLTLNQLRQVITNILKEKILGEFTISL